VTVETLLECSRQPRSRSSSRRWRAPRAVGARHPFPPQHAL